MRRCIPSLLAPVGHSLRKGHSRLNSGDWTPVECVGGSGTRSRERASGRLPVSVERLTVEHLALAEDDDGHPRLRVDRNCRLVVVSHLVDIGVRSPRA